MSLGNWIFRYRNAETGEVVEIDARPDAPFYLQHDGRVYEFSERSFVAEPGVMHFYEAMRLTPCPKIPSKPAEAPKLQFDGWTGERALEEAARLDSRQLLLKCEADPGFAEALNSTKQEPRQLEGISQAARDADYFAEIANRNRGRGFDVRNFQAPPQPPTDAFVDIGRGEMVRKKDLR